MTEPVTPPRAAEILAWYDRNRRRLPWRTAPGARADPYPVWLSEIMLQQTTVVAVIPYFQRFMEAWPTIGALGAAPLEKVLEAWAGLGYYARARNLHACARTVREDHGGRFPDTEDGLRALPGIGPYTAAAIAAMVFDRPAVVVDGNVERVMARLNDIDQPMPAAKRLLHEAASRLTPSRRAGDYAQAVMDLGATVCTPRQPACDRCPWSEPCLARARGVAAERPVRAPRVAKPTRHGIAFWLQRADGSVLLRRRPPRGLLGGMMELPGTVWQTDMPKPAAVRKAAPLAADWAALPGTVRHVFTHFRLEVAVHAARVEDHMAHDRLGHWCPMNDLADQALPTVMRKIAAHARAAF